MTASRKSSVPILTYHSIDDSGSVISTPPARFREQMQWLAAHDYRAITMSSLLDAWEKRESLPERTVVITFDDAMVNVATHAWPLLTDLGFRATVYVVSGHLGAFNDWAGQAGIPRLSLLTVDALRDMQQSGMEIGAHSVTHANLVQLSGGALEEEVVAGKHALEADLGAPVTTFAYPYGAVSPEARALVARHYRAALGTTLSRASLQDDRFELPRVDMYYFRPRFTQSLFDGMAGALYLGARAAARNVRARLAK